MKKQFLLLLLFIVGTLNVYSGTFTSNGGNTSWNAGAAAWTIVGDADGIPDSDDDVVIQSGHTIIWGSVSTSTCRNLTVDAGGTISSTGGAVRILNLHGNYIINGTETANGTIVFLGAGTTIGGTGTHSPTSQWSFSSSRTISNISITKNYWIRVYGATTVITNNGNLTLYSLNCYNATATWRQGPNSTLRIRTSFLMSSPTLGIFDASTNPNLVILDWTPLKTIPAVFNNRFYNLQLPSNRFAQSSVDFEVLNNLTIGNNSSLTLNHNLSIGGNLIGIVNSNLIQAAGTTITMNGGGAQNISTPGYSFQNLEIDNSGTGVSFTLPNSYSILQSLAITNGTLTIPATTTVTLVSNAGQTAFIGPSNGTITGSLTLQRFISGRAAGYSDMSTPLSSGTFADLDDDIILAYSYNPPWAYPSAWSYNESTYDYVPVTDVTTNMFQGVGYEVYLDSDGSQTSWADGTIDFIGAPTLGSVDISGNLSFDNDGWNLVGNPYHANLSWDLFQGDHADVDPTFMFYDEGIEDFATATTGSGELLAPGQGFWINVTTGSPTVVFSENHKSNSTSSNFRHQSQKLFAVRLKSVGGTKFTSATEYRFDTDYRELPFKKIAHPDAPQFYSLNDKNGLRIKNLNSQENTITIPLGISIGTEGLYTISPENINEVLALGYTKVEVKDNLKHSVTEITNDAYQFYAEKGKDDTRFELILTKGEGTENQSSSADAIDINRIDNNVRINFQLLENKNVNVSILNPLGQQIVPSQTVNVLNEVRYFALPQDYSGIVIVNVTIDGKNISKKLFK